MVTSRDKLSTERLKGSMVLTPQDLQAIKELVTANNEVLLEQVDVMIDKKLEQQNRDIAQVIN